MKPLLQTVEVLVTPGEKSVVKIQTIGKITGGTRKI
jgi:hypothetical protein